MGQGFNAGMVAMNSNLKRRSIGRPTLNFSLQPGGATVNEDNG